MWMISVRYTKEYMLVREKKLCYQANRRIFTAITIYKLNSIM